MKGSTVLILCFLFAVNISFAQIQNSIPQSFGLLTVTHTRGTDNSQFMKYLNRYATMDCPVISQISIVWNNEQTPQELGVFVNQNQWKRPIYFYKTPNNSMNWRYKIPKESQVQVFFSIDDDITVDCQQLNKGFAVWQSLAVGNIAPIVSYGPRFYQYTPIRGFQYVIGKTQNFFAIGLAGLAFVSKHLLQLYYADLFELNEMRKYIVEKNNCDDIGLNWVVQYYYPELITKPITGNIQNISPRIGQTTGKTHYIFRSECLKTFTKIFGVSLRFAPLIDDFPGHNQRMYPLKQSLILAKKEYFDTIILKKEGNKVVNSTYGIDLLKKYVSNVQLKIDAGKIQQMQQDMIIDIKQMVERLTEYNHKLQQLNNGLVSEILDCKKQSSNSNGKFIQQSYTDSQDESEVIKQLKRSIYFHSYAQLFLVIVILILLWLLMRQSDKSSLNTTSSDEIESDGTGLGMQHQNEG